MLKDIPAKIEWLDEAVCMILVEMANCAEAKVSAKK